MTQVTVESEHEGHEDLAEALADAQVEAAHTLEREQAVERAEEAADAALETAQTAHTEALTHEHTEYALAGHTHEDLNERLTRVEGFIAGAVVAAEENAQQEENEAVEEIEPAEETQSAEIEPESESHAESTHHGLRRGR